MIWDVITLAYLQGLATAETVPRPTLDGNMNFKTEVGSGETMQNITYVDSEKLWAGFVAGLDRLPNRR